MIQPSLPESPVLPSVPDDPAEELRRGFAHHLRRTLARDRYSATNRDYYCALALAVRDRLIDRWIATQQTHHKSNVKRVYYLSLEFLMGRLLGNNVINLELETACPASNSAAGFGLGATARSRVRCGPR